MLRARKIFLVLVFAISFYQWHFCESASGEARQIGVTINPETNTVTIDMGAGIVQSVSRGETRTITSAGGEVFKVEVSASGDTTTISVVTGEIGLGADTGTVTVGQGGTLAVTVDQNGFMNVAGVTGTVNITDPDGDTKPVEEGDILGAPDPGYASPPVSTPPDSTSPDTTPSPEQPQDVTSPSS